ncbi:MAG: leucine-rich repeat protein [Tannerellaceae bacterium]|jgi:hypothetical protein|nr:leucine-rich repeat protein [Tannerellaceae bacterium]
MKTPIQFLLITGVFSLLLSCTGKDKVQQTMSDEEIDGILSEALSYLSGQDYANAAAYYQIAAQQGNAEGELYSGLFHFAGQGVEKDLTKAARLWKRALEHPSFDEPEEMSLFFRGMFFNLANAYSDGEGIKKKQSEAVFWYRKAAECGMPIAQYSLGACYLLGNGVGKDENAALYWLKQARESGELDKASDAYAEAMVKMLIASGASYSEVKAEGNPFMGKALEKAAPGSVEAVFNEYTHTLTIKGKGAMTDYNDDIETPWKSYDDEIETLVIEEGITKVGDQSFWFCEGITDIKLPRSLKSIGERAFSRTGISRIDLPGSLESIDMGAFLESELTSVFVPASVKEIGSAAFASRPLTAVHVAAGNPYFTSLDGVLFDKRIERLLLYPEGMPGDYEIPGTVKEISEMAFSRNLTSVKIPASVERIGMFAFVLAELEKVTVSWDKPLVFAEDRLASFGNVSQCTLYVPKGTKNAYQTAGEWSKFGIIEEY